MRRRRIPIRSQFQSWSSLLRQVAGLTVLALVLVGHVAAQNPVITSLENSASRDMRFAPGVLAIARGTNLGPTILINGRAAGFVRIIDAATIQLQIPVELEPGAATLVMERGGTRSEPFNFTLQRYAPSVFTANQIGTGTVQGFRGNFTVISSNNRPVGGENVSVLAFGLGATNPQVPTGMNASAPTPLVVSPRVVLGCHRQPVVFAGLVPGFPSVSQVTFTLPAAFPAGVHSLRLDSAGTFSNEVELPVSGPETPAIRNVVNGASFDPAAPIAPGSFVSVFGVNFGPRTELGVFPATELDGMSVTMNGVPAPLFHVLGTSNQLNLLAPVELPESGTIAVQVRTRNGVSLNCAVQVAAAAPGIFVVRDPANASRKAAAVLLANTRWLVLPDSTARALQIPGNCRTSGIGVGILCAQPAAPGDIVQLFVTGLGKATPGGDPDGTPLATGAVAPADGNPLYATVQRPVVRIGGIQAQVLFSGIAPGFVGLYQINVLVPDVPNGDDISLIVSMPGAADDATIAIRR